MNRPRRPEGIRVRLEIALWRRGWIWLLAGVALCAAGLVEALQTRPVQEELAQTKAAITALQSAAADARHRQAATAQAVYHSSKLELIERVLKDAGPADEQMRLVLDAATHHAIELPRAEYQSSVDPETHVARVQVSFPIKASYPRLRGFVEEVLRTLPNASVDHIAFKREAVAQADVEATVRLSLWGLAGERVQPIVAVTARGGGS